MNFAGQIDDVIAIARIDIFDIHNRRIGCTAPGMITVKNDRIIAITGHKRVIAVPTQKAVIGQVFAGNIGNVAGAICGRAADVIGCIAVLRNGVTVK